MLSGLFYYSRKRSKRRTFLYTYHAAQSEAAFRREIAVAPKVAFLRKVGDLRLLTTLPLHFEKPMNFTFAHIPPSTPVIFVFHTVGDGLQT
jgi:hypothetical protein